MAVSSLVSGSIHVFSSGGTHSFTAHNVFTRAFTLTAPGLHGWEILVRGLVLLTVVLVWLRFQPSRAVNAGR
ncbi:hypothetical protein [Allokutzneria albata]|uniref:Uncharacterized protein n=1 Tax=Allokutzneria albata TaxID=211114 RepID=A0A1G9RIS3_ALLAB|nr:hypothetical protein [Allokutzneria albata]SDM22345.1 hypothetical protein SAMN04489726_0451 [Allokutzneria albata]